MKCGDCQRTLEPGDRYIKDTASGYIGVKSDPVIDDLVAGIMNGTLNEHTGEGKTADSIIFCENCTVKGGDYLFETVYGDESEAGAPEDD